MSSLPFASYSNAGTLLCGIRANLNVKGVQVHSREFKIATFVTDILLFLSPPLMPLPNLMQDLEHFNLLANLQINYSKSFAPNVLLPPELVQQCQANFPFWWKLDAITYLGIQLPANLSDLYAKNFVSELQAIHQDLHRWSKSTISSFGRASITIMTILPHILYKLQTLPIQLPPSFFTFFKAICIAFLWNNKSVWIGWSKLVLPKSSGGIGLPNLQCYY